MHRLSLAILASCLAAVPALATPPGAPTTAATRALETGAKVLQRQRPVAALDIYLVGFHPMKAQPEQQMEAHHYCHQLNEDLAQCALFDDNGAQARLNGIEYIISEKLFESLPQEERQYWHPHNGEILSGQLLAPGLPAIAEKALMKSKMNSYGKTWHVWHGGQASGLPLGEPMLAWSFNRDGEARPGLIEERDRKMKLDSKAVRRARADLLPLARPQSGVDALRGKFTRPATDIPGVVNK